MASSPSCTSKLIRDSLGVVDYLGHWLGIYLSDGSTSGYISIPNNLHLGVSLTGST
jgi:hypothetical protein